MRKTDTTEAGRIQCLDRAMDVLALVGERSEVGATEAARELGLHVATVHNILSTLAARRFLVNVGGRYSLGPALTALVSQWSPARILARLSGPVLVAAAQATGETPLLAVLTGTSLQVVASAWGLDEVTTQFSQRTVADPLAYGTGHLLVAFAPEALWDMFIHQHETQTPAPEISREAREWRTVLATIRRQERAFVHRRSGTDSCAVPVRGPTGEVMAALGVSCPASRSTATQRDTIFAALLEAAGTLEAQLAGKPA
jgi:IclR family acetate operon transcriptional repressor